MVGVAQRLERLPVEQEVAGSNPVSHPMSIDYRKIIVFWFVPIILLSFWYLREIIFPFLVGIILGLVIQTISFFLNYKLKINYYLNVFLIYTFLIILFSSTFYLTFKVILNQLPSLFFKLQPYINELNLKRLDFIKNWQEFLTLGGDYLPNIFRFIYNFIGGFFSLILIFIVSIYTSLNKNFPKEIFDLLPEEKREDYFRLWRKIKRRVSFWMLGQLVLMLTIGLATYLFVGPILKINYAGLIGLTAGLLEIIPIIGPTFSLIMASIITFLDKPDLVLIVAVFFVLLQQLENHFLVPILMKRAVAINPLLIILGVLIGGKLGGILGIILTLPILGAIVEIFNYYKEKS